MFDFYMADFFVCVNVKCKKTVYFWMVMTCHILLHDGFYMMLFGLDCLTCLFLLSASEPNLKVRSALKQKVMERRITQSPILRRRDKGFLFKRKTPLSSMYSYARFGTVISLC
jgi:hypothetical protein